MDEVIEFLKLEDFLLPSPLPACLAILICLGFKYLGSYLVSFLRQSVPSPVESAAGFILVTGLTASFVHLLGFLGVAYLWPIRLLSWAFALIGLISLFRLKQASLLAIFRSFNKMFRQQPFYCKLGISLVFITGVSLFLASLGPPTDADSLDYHLGVPLDILRNHQAYMRMDWLHARLIGLGESLNMLGLAGGTDVLGASLQFSGLLAVLLSLLTLVKTDFERIFTAILVMGCPLLLFLIPNQKPQMLPVAATTVALILLVRNFKSLDYQTYILAFGCACFAMSCKYSFLLSGSTVIVTGLIAAYKFKKLGIAALIAMLGVLVFLLPLCLQKYFFYGDPLSPLLEKYLAQSQVSVISFADFLKNYRDSSVMFPFSLILPDSPGTISTILGVGCFIIFAASRVRGYSIVFLICAMIAAIATFFLGQVTSRFYLEPYLWIIAAVVSTPMLKVNSLFLKLILVQLFCVAIMASVGAVILFPGALTASLRHKVMYKCAYQYGESNWLDETLPKDAVILSDLRSKALLPRKFVSSEKFYYSLNTNDTVALEKEKLLIKQSGVNTWVTFDNNTNPFPYFAAYFPRLIAKSQTFRNAVRNPWNATTSGQIVVYGIVNTSKY